MNLPLQVLATKTPTHIDLAVVSDLIARAGSKPEDIVALLQAVQEHFHYLPAEALRHIAAHANITPAALTGVATFFQQFRHQPAGEHLVRICHGTACHVQGSERVEEFLRRHLHMTPQQETDASGKYTLERVGCVGCCTLAPVVVTDGATHGRVRLDAIASVLEIVPQRQELAEDSAPAADTPPAGKSASASARAVPPGAACVCRTFSAAKPPCSACMCGSRASAASACATKPRWSRCSGRNGGKGVLYTRLKDASDESIRAIVRRHFRPRAGRVVA